MVKIGTSGINPSQKWVSLTLLQKRDFLRLWLANGLWWQAMWMEQLVLGWVALSLTDSAWLVALVGFFRQLPLMLIGLFSAAISDRFKRRSTIVVLQGVNAAGVGLLAVLSGLGILAYWHIAAVALVNGTSWALDWPTRRALLPDLVGKERVLDAMVLENLMQSLTRLSGPLGAGDFLATVGEFGTLVILSFVALLSTLILLGMKTDSRAPTAPRGLLASWQSTLEGLRYVVGQPRILGVLLTTLAMNCWLFPYMNLLPVFARDVLHQGPAGLGILGVFNGLGTLIGLVIINAGRHKWSREWIFIGGSLLACLGLSGFAFSTSFHLSLALLLMAGIGHAGFSIMQGSIVLLEAADEMRGRAMGTLVLAIGGGPLGRLQSGAMAAAWGAPLAVGSMSVLAGLAILGVVAFVPGFIRRYALVGKGIKAPAAVLQEKNEEL